MTTFIKDRIHLPERVHRVDFVLNLADGVRHARQTLDTYVVTPQLATCFRNAMGFIKSALDAKASRAAYLHGSSGAGKSHFMAVPHLLLQHDPLARTRDELAPVCAENAWAEGRKFLLVPYHRIGSQNLESALLGGYARFAGEQLEKAVEASDGRLYKEDRVRIPVRQVVVPIRIGEMGENHLVPGRHWLSYGLRRLDDSRGADAESTLRTLREAVAQDEFGARLEPALRQASSAAARLLARVPHPPVVTPPPVVATAPVTDVSRPLEPLRPSRPELKQLARVEERSLPARAAREKMQKLLAQLPDDALVDLTWTVWKKS